MNPLQVFWVGLPKWGQELLLALGLFIGFLIFGRIWLEAHDMQVRSRERQKAENDTIKAVTKIQQEARHDADAAIEARDTASRYPDAVSVPVEQAGRIFSN